MLNSYGSFLDPCIIIAVGFLYLRYGGQPLPRDGTARVSVTSITTDDNTNGLMCLYSIRTVGGGGAIGIMWFLNGAQLDRLTGQSYLGWSVDRGVYHTYPISSLKRDAHTVATEGVFTCRREELSVVVGIYYPSKLIF